MNLSLITKLVCIVLLCCNALGFSQTSKDTLPKTKEVKTHLNFEISGILPFAQGSNFASEGMNFRYGFNIGLKGYFNDNIFIGLSYKHLRAEVSDKSLVGSFEHSNVNTWQFIAGYRFLFNDILNLEPFIGYGTTVYRNKKTSTTLDTIDFYDEANSLIFGTSIAYKFSEYFSLILSPEYRIDFTDIKTAAFRQSFFDEAHFLNILVGIRIGY